MKIIVDAMGGDNAPAAPIQGAVDAVNAREDVFVYLAGKEDVINAELAKYTYPKERIEILPASQVIETAEPPVIAIKGKKDPLLGLKENVIIGKLIPAGTGMSRYKDIQIDVTPLPQRVDEITEEIDEAIALTEADSLEDAMPTEEEYATPVLSTLAEEIVEAIQGESQDDE